MSQNLVSCVDDLWSKLKLPACMAAYVGKNYGKQEEKEKILVIGECMTIMGGELDSIAPDEFYSGRLVLSSEQQNLLNYRAFVYYRGGRFVKNIEKSIIRNGQSMDDIAMFNFFQRPILGNSRDNQWSEKDIEIGVKTCHEVIGLLRPTKVIFVSSKVTRLVEREHGRLFQEEFWTFAERLVFKYIGVPHPSYWRFNFNAKEEFEKFVSKKEVHGQERFRQLSAQFELAVFKKNLDELIRLAKEFQAEVDFMDEKRQRKCGVVRMRKEKCLNEEDRLREEERLQNYKQKSEANCKIARVAKKAKKVCGVITELLQKYLNDMNNIVNADSDLDGRSKDALKAEMKIRRDIACKDANAEITKFKEEFAAEEALKEQLEKSVKQISDVRDAQLSAIDTLISSV